ncbi:hypothetical protein TFLX_03140 [Thermoflexales bacterium]|nr:hypothetical protein TFLX_03140 [Thermoflexales bacterium]
MLGSDDLDQMRNDMAVLRDDRVVSVVIRRGNATPLAAQQMRVAGGGSGNLRKNSGKTQETRDQVVLLGATTVDIQIDDRFTLTVASKPVLYRVTWVRPDRSIATMARAEAIE